MMNKTVLAIIVGLTLPAAALAASDSGSQSGDSQMQGASASGSASGQSATSSGFSGDSDSDKSGGSSSGASMSGGGQGSLRKKGGSNGGSTSSSDEQASSSANSSASGGQSGSMNFMTQPRSGQMTAKGQLIGHGVHNSQGKKIGTISNLIVNKQGRIEGVVIASGGIMGIGAKTVALPWDKVHFKSGKKGKNVVVDLSKKQINDAPAFQARAQQKKQQSGQSQKQQ